MYRQGDVLLIPVKALPRGENKVREDNIVERGEVTGHAHRIENGTVLDHVPSDRSFAADVPQAFVQAFAGARLVHEEHATIDLPGGTYRVVRQREFDGSDARYVSD